MSLDRFLRRRNATPDVVYTGTTDDPVDENTNHFEPGLAQAIDTGQTDDLLDRD